MGEYLTLEEAAQHLGVEYKTLYRLVRSGELPCGRIGRLYRIRIDDLEEYFERQKQLLAQQARRTGLTALEGLRCGACGKPILSELSKAGRCEECEADICLACWMVKKVRRCASHTTAAAGGEAGPAGVVTGTHAVSAIGPVAGEQQTAETVEQVIARLRQEGKPVVTGPEARLSEETFLRSFNQLLETIEQLPDPLSQRTIPLRQARVKHEVATGFAAGDDLPANRSSRFTLKTGGWGRPSARVILEGRFVSRPETIASRGYDAEPVGAAELTALLNSLVEEAKKPDCFWVVLLGSPTGWADAARAIIFDARGHRSFRDRRVAVVLSDLHTNEVCFDETDERLRAFWPLFAADKYAEALSTCVDKIRDALLRKNSLSLTDAVRACNADASWVHAAFEQLKRDGTYTTDELSGIGTVISRR